MITINPFESRIILSLSVRIKNCNNHRKDEVLKVQYVQNNTSLHPGHPVLGCYEDLVLKYVKMLTKGKSF